MATINKSINNKSWQGCGERRTLLHCWWECRLMQPPSKAVWRYLKKLKMDLPLDPAIPLLGIYPNKPKTLIWNNIRTRLFTAALFAISKVWKQPKSISRWVDKTTIGHLHDGILLGRKKEENFGVCDSMDWPVVHYDQLNKPVRERQIPYDFTHVWNLMNKQGI